MTNCPLTTLRSRLAAGGDDRLSADLGREVLARRQERGEHREWALLCEDAGLMSLAFSEFQLALRDDPHDCVAAWHLAQHYRERGENGRAAGLLDRLLAQEPAHREWLALYVEILCEDGAEPRAEAALQRALAAGLAASDAEALHRRLGPQPVATDATAPPVPGEPAELPTDADVVRFHTLFSGREGLYARQWVRPNGEGGYTPVHEPLTPAVVRNHLLGTYTVGVYPIRLDGTATFFAIDLDIDKTTLQRAQADHGFAQSVRETLRSEGPRLAAVLRDLGFHPLLENSGYKGRHLWVFLEQPEPAEVLHLFGKLLLSWQAPLVPVGLHLEFFPKQGSLKGQGLGNLIKLPLGIHRRTGKRSMLLDQHGVAVAEPYAELRGVRPAARRDLHHAIERLKALDGARAAAATGGAPPAGDAGEIPFTPDGAPPAEAAASRPAPPPPPRSPLWTEADFEADPRIRHLLSECPVLAELKRTVDEHRRLSHEEQLVLIHSLGHVEGGPQAVNYLLNQCVDVGPEKLMKDRLKGNPVSCPSIRKKIPQVTRRVRCHCPFDFAKDRYPTPVLHLLTLPPPSTAPAARTGEDVATLAQRYGVADRRRAEIERECAALRDALVERLRGLPEREVACEGGRWRLREQEGVEELRWEPDGSSG